MTPQMLKALKIFMEMFLIDQSVSLFDFKQKERVRKFTKLTVIVACMKFISLVYRQWQYLG